MDFTPRTIMTKSLLFKTPSMMMADLFLNPNEKKVYLRVLIMN